MPSLTAKLCSSYRLHSYVFVMCHVISHMIPLADVLPDALPSGDFDKWRPDPGEQLIKVQNVFVHPHFHSYTFDSDIALLYLARPVVRGPAAAPACLPDHHLSKYLLQVRSG